MKPNHWIAKAARRCAPLALGPCLLMLASCLESFELAAPQPMSCANRRLSHSAALYEEAKDFLSLHYKERGQLPLLYAYYASLDAEQITRTIQFCDDYSPQIKQRGTAMIRAVRTLRKAALLNMRDGDPMVLVQMLGRKYDEVFKSDIH